MEIPFDENVAQIPMILMFSKTLKGEGDITTNKTLSLRS